MESQTCKSLQFSSRLESTRNAFQADLKIPIKSTSQAQADVNFYVDTFLKSTSQVQGGRFINSSRRLHKFKRA